MFNDLKGKRILITGSTAGMGLATARILQSTAQRLASIVVLSAQKSMTFSPNSPHWVAMLRFFLQT